MKLLKQLHGCACAQQTISKEASGQTNFADDVDAFPGNFARLYDMNHKTDLITGIFIFVLQLVYMCNYSKLHMHYCYYYFLHFVLCSGINSYQKYT